MLRLQSFRCQLCLLSLSGCRAGASVWWHTEVRSGMQQDPGMQEMMSAMHQPGFQETMAERLNAMKGDPEIANIVRDVESRGPSAMMKCVILSGPRT